VPAVDRRAPQGAHVSLVGLRKAFGATPAVDDLTLHVPRGSFTTLLGPSGCGKTTALRLVGGFLEPDAGRVLIGGVDQVGRPPNLRGVGMVFQDYALFPHLSVRANLEYGLRMQRVERALRAERVARAVALLGLAGLEGRYPHELSGGQQQRVALGRVLVLEPEVLLMDEPFSSLDAQLRLRLRAELKALQRELGVTTIYVTHDQEEALSLSDQVVVMDRGRVQQVDSPEGVYLRPANRFVAEFVGQANLLPVQVTATGSAAPAGGLTLTALGRPLSARLPDERRPEPGARGLAMVRPEHVVLLTDDVPPPAGGWRAAATVRARSFHGGFERYWVELPGVTEPWLVDVPLGPSLGGTTPASGRPAPGASVSIALPAFAASWLW